MTVADTNGRCTLFIGTVSGALIAIAFAGQSSSMGTAFFVFSLVLFPSLFFMGLFTFERVLQAGIEDLIYARGIMRIRQLYLEHAPQMQPYFILSAHNAIGQPLLDVGVNPFWWQVFLTAAGMIAFINSILTGTIETRHQAGVYRRTRLRYVRRKSCTWPHWTQRLPRP